MLSRLKKKNKKKGNLDIKQVLLLVVAGAIILAIIKFKASNPFVSHH